jgi:long-chain acyl-CoA synthetase
MHLLLDLLEKNVVHRGDYPAACDQSLSLNYRSFRAVACGLAGRIAAESRQPRVGILAPPSTASAVAGFACWYAGKVPVPLNFVLAPSELAQVVRDAGLDLVLAIDRFAPLVAAAALRVLPLDRDTLVPGERPAPAASPDETAVVIYTSGTTGQPKGACLSFDNLAQNVSSCIAAAELSPDQVFLSLLPQFHAFGFTTNTLVPLLMGATVHYLPRFSPLAVVNLIHEQRVSVFITIASMFGALAAMKNAGPEQLASLTHPISGGEPLSPKVAQGFQQRFGKRIYEGYGLTEASPVVTLNTPRVHRAGSVGRPLPGISVAAVDREGRELTPGLDGELVVRGHCVMQGYLNQPQATASVIRDRALHTGDIGHLDADGFVYITGRAKEMIIVGGENVFPFEIESVLLDHPAVAEAAVIGVPDEVRGEVPAAFVILAPGGPRVTEADLRTFCRERLAAYKVPRKIQVADELPRGPTGKILKRALASRLD